MHIIFIGLWLIFGLEVLATIANFIALCRGNQQHSNIYYVTTTTLGTLISYFFWYTINNIQVI